MLLFALAWLAGNASCLWLKPLPKPLWLIIALIINVSAIFSAAPYLRRWLSASLFFILGLIWITINVQLLLAKQLPDDFIGQALVITGVVSSIPEQKDFQTHFIFKATKIINSSGEAFEKPIQLRLSWYFAPRFLAVGQTWRLQVRLKKPAADTNNNGFNYQQWLLAQQILAAGYVQKSERNLLLSQTHFLKWLDKLRESIADNVAKNLYGKPLSGLIQALAVGVRGDITEEQWDVLRGTGTNHLFAIAGLHIGFITGFTYFITGFIWRRLGRAPLLIPTPLIATFMALLMAIIYSALAGFSIPTQRATIMMAVFLSAALAKRKVPLWHSFSMALILVLIFDPFAVLSASFWMSFSAVALIIYGISGRMHKASKWRHWFYPQWVIAVGLIPISLLFFQQYSFASLLANLIAIPWVGFLVLPLSFTGSLTTLFFPGLGKFILILAEYLLSVIWPLLTAMARLDWAQWYAAITNPWVFITAMIAVTLLLAPRGIPARWLAVIGLSPLLFWQPAGPPAGEVWLTLFDINKGVAVLIRTHKKIMLYESGIQPAVNNNVVLPYLHYLRVKKIDQWIINTPVNTNPIIFSLLDLIPVKQVFLNELNSHVQGDTVLCRQGLNEQSEDARWFVSAFLPENRKGRDVCALRIWQKGSAALITDVALIKLQDENPLLNQAQPINILITAYKVPQQDLIDFIERLKPGFIFLSTRKPSGAKILSQTAQIYSTADSGMLNIHLKNAASENVVIEKGNKTM